MYKNQTCTFIGKIGKDPVTRDLGQSGNSVASSSLAIYKSKTHTMWLNLSAFGSMAEQLMKAKKGDEVKIYGEIWDREYEVNGVKRVSLDLTVRGIEIEPKKASETEPPVSTPSQEVPF